MNQKRVKLGTFIFYFSASWWKFLDLVLVSAASIFSLFFSLFVSFFFFFSFFNFFLVYFALLRVVNVCINGNRILNLVFRLSPCFSGFLDLFEVRVFDADAIELS